MRQKVLLNPEGPLRKRTPTERKKFKKNLEKIEEEHKKLLKESGADRNKKIIFDI